LPAFKTKVKNEAKNGSGIWDMGLGVGAGHCACPLSSKMAKVKQHDNFL